MRALLIIFIFIGPLSAQPAADVRATVSRALPILQKSAGEFVSKRACVSCHHNLLSILALPLARSSGFDIDRTVLTSVEDKTFRSLRASNGLDEAIQATTLNDPTPNDSYLLMAAHAAVLPPDLTTAIYA